jgi:hypothetical protein
MMLASLLGAPLSLPPALLPSGDGRPYEAMTTEELEARIIVNEERLNLYRQLGRVGGAVGTLAIRKTLFPR